MTARKGASKEAELRESKRRKLIQGTPGWFITKKENTLRNNLRQKNIRGERSGGKDKEIQERGSRQQETNAKVHYSQAAKLSLTFLALDHILSPAI